MYEQHFGLKTAPFSMTPDYAFLLQTAAHREALAGLTYAVLRRKGFCVLMGEAGTGKTTVLQKVLRTLPPERIQLSLIVNPALTRDEFLEAVLLDFGLTNIPASKPRRLLALQEFILAARAEGKTCLLAVDEAHKLTPDLLEEVRLLTNLETSQEKLLQIFLVGQPELSETLNRPDMRQLKQRVAVRLELQPLAETQLSQYLQHRWKCGLGEDRPHPFTPEAVGAIAVASTGIPRIINAICDGALLVAFGMGQHEVDAAIIGQVVKGLDLESPARRAQMAAGPVPAAPVTAASVRTEPLAVPAAANVVAPAPLAGRSAAAPEPVAMPEIPLLTLHRYAAGPERAASLLTRWAIKFGIVSERPAL